MSWPFEQRLAHYDAWLASAAIAFAALGWLGIDLLALRASRAHVAELRTSATEPPAGWQPLPTLRGELSTRARAVRREVGQLGARLRMPAAPPRTSRVADAVRRRTERAALEALLPDGFQPAMASSEHLRLTRLVLDRFEKGGASTDALTAFRLADGRPRAIGGALIDSATHTRLDMSFTAPPSVLHHVLHELTAGERPRLLLVRLLVTGGQPEVVEVELELLHVDLSVRQALGLPSAVRDPEEGWTLEKPSAGRRW